MKIKHEKSLMSPEVPNNNNNGNNNQLNRIECVSWSSSNVRLAVCTAANNQVTLFNGNTGDKKEKFSLKPIEKEFSRRSFVVKGIDFSPDSSKIAIGQSDHVIFIYKIGENWGDKKSIVGKYTLQSSCTCLTWHPMGIIFGSVDGKVRMIQNNNRMVNLMTSNSMVINISICGDELLAGFISGSVILTTIGSRDPSRQLTVNPVPPFGLALTQNGFAAIGGCDGKLTLINTKSSNDSSVTKSKQSIELGSDISYASAAPSSNVIIVSIMDRMIVLNFDTNSHSWKQLNNIELEGGHLITCIQWSRDGTKVVIGTVNGGLELFSFQFRKKKLNECLEVDYVGTSQVVIRDVLNQGPSATFRSSYEIKDVKIVRDVYIIIWSSNSLILGDIRQPGVISELDWTGMTQAGVKFCFDYDNVILISVVGELFIVEFGSNSVLSSVRTDFVNPHLMSVRINERKSENKIFAYLLDMKTGFGH